MVSASKCGQISWFHQRIEKERGFGYLSSVKDISSPPRTPALCQQIKREIGGEKFKSGESKPSLYYRCPFSRCIQVLIDNIWIYEFDQIKRKDSNIILEAGAKFKILMSRAEKKGQVHGGVHTWHQPSQPQNLSPSGITSWDIVFDYILSICHFQLLLLLLWQRVGHQSHSQHLWTTLGVWEGRWSVRCTLGGPATGLEVLQRFMEEEASKKKSNFLFFWKLG